MFANSFIPPVFFFGVFQSLSFCGSLFACWCISVLLMALYNALQWPPWCFVEKYDALHCCCCGDISLLLVALQSSCMMIGGVE